MPPIEDAVWTDDPRWYSPRDIRIGWHQPRAVFYTAEEAIIPRWLYEQMEFMDDG